MKTFEELIKENEELNDKRLKVFKELRTKLKETYIPVLAKVLTDTEIEHIVVELKNRPFPWYEAHTSYYREGEFYYLLGITDKGLIIEADEEFDRYKLYSAANPDNIADLSKDAIIELCTAIKKQIEKLNKRMQNKISAAEDIIND